MKTTVRLLFLTSIALPFLTTQAYAGGPGTTLRGWQTETRTINSSPNGSSSSGFTPRAERTFGEPRGFDDRRGFGGFTFGNRSGIQDGNPQPGTPNAPLDGGLSLLLAAGLGLGVKRAMNRNKAAAVDIAE